MKRICVLSSFKRSLKKLTPQDRKQLANGLEEFNSFLVTGNAPAGLGFKKINHDKFEFRISIRLRVVVKAEGDDYCFVLAGNHDDVKRYLRSFR
jgi:mRNA-degrading endonuclease RelE of RelBE toxin-antitoxin system